MVVLGPLRHVLKDKQLLIVKDGILHGLPFAPLPDPNAKGEMLIDHHILAVLPSATHGVLAQVVQSWRQTAPRSALVLADPIYSRDDPRLPPGPKQANPHSVQRLPQTAREAAAIKALQGDALVLRGAAANKRAFLDQALDQFRVVHFGVHGQLHEQHPSLSRLLLSHYDAYGQECDGALRAQELATLAMPVELVTLSGCRTAMGRDYRGEGQWSLGRDFMSAGALRVLVSLWDVDDMATAELMTQFYQGLWREGLAPAAALRQAQLHLRAQHNLHSAYYWAAFELQGDLFPLHHQKKTKAVNPVPASVSSSP